MLPVEEIEYTLPLQLKDDQGPYEVHPSDPMFAVYLDRLKESVRGCLLKSAFSPCCALFVCSFQNLLDASVFPRMRRFLFCLSLCQHDRVLKTRMGYVGAKGPDFPGLPTAVARFAFQKPSGLTARLVPWQANRACNG